MKTGEGGHVTGSPERRWAERQVSPSVKKLKDIGANLLLR